MVRSGTKPPVARAAKYLLQQRGIDDPEQNLRHILTHHGVTLERCSKARSELAISANAQPLETILTGLTTAGVSDALARQICGLDTECACRRRAASLP